MSTQVSFTEENQQMATAISKTDAQQLAPSDPMAIIAMAVQNNVDPAQLEKLMELQERWERNRAAEAYGNAIVEFQRRCPKIVKDKEAKIVSQKGSYSYKYAGYDDVMEVAGPILADLGLAVSTSTQAIEKGIRATMRVRKGIHFEDHTMDVPVPAMNVNDTQRYGAALSFVKRYLFGAVFNIVFGDEVDDDGASCLDPVSEEQYEDLDKMMIRVVEKHGDGARAKLLKWMQVARLAEVPATKFDKAMQGMRDALNAPQQQ